MACIICLDTEPGAWGWCDPMPCACRGTTKLHEGECLRAWMRSCPVAERQRLEGGGRAKATLRCTTCRGQFAAIESAAAGGLPWLGAWRLVANADAGQRALAWLLVWAMLACRVHIWWAARLMPGAERWRQSLSAAFVTDAAGMGVQLCFGLFQTLVFDNEGEALRAVGNGLPRHIFLLVLGANLLVQILVDAFGRGATEGSVVVRALLLGLVPQLLLSAYLFAPHWKARMARSLRPPSYELVAPDRAYDPAVKTMDASPEAARRRAVLPRTATTRT